MFRSLLRSRLLKQEAVPIIIVSKTPKQIPKVGSPSSATDGNNMQPDGTKQVVWRTSESGRLRLWARLRQPTLSRRASSGILRRTS
ncbi:hypothetical protein AVEN_28987-1 [Araneus ventricosus]|uniref:Uncharacterized protein n=1 Tax=Araneus ventricosus TaxID=182803 RepID=A0A4Y2AJY2_ARAVE|nr:hypothetical protein AVEN_28987-1 [Araneus ventricosus]